MRYLASPLSLARSLTLSLSLSLSLSQRFVVRLKPSTSFPPHSLIAHCQGHLWGQVVQGGGHQDVAQAPRPHGAVHGL